MRLEPGLGLRGAIGLRSRYLESGPVVPDAPGLAPFLCCAVTELDRLIDARASEKGFCVAVGAAYEVQLAS